MRTLLGRLAFVAVWFATTALIVAGIMGLLRDMPAHAVVVANTPDRGLDRIVRLYFQSNQIDADAGECLWLGVGPGEVPPDAINTCVVTHSTLSNDNQRQLATIDPGGTFYQFGCDVRSVAGFAAGETFTLALRTHVAGGPSVALLDPSWHFHADEPGFGVGRWCANPGIPTTVNATQAACDSPLSSATASTVIPSGAVAIGLAVLGDTAGVNAEARFQCWVDIAY